MGNCEEPLHKREPPIEISASVRIVKREVHRLLIVGRRIVIIHQCNVDTDRIEKRMNWRFQSEPPPRIFLAEDSHRSGGMNSSPVPPTTIPDAPPAPEPERELVPPIAAITIAMGMTVKMRKAVVHPVRGYGLDSRRRIARDNRYAWLPAWWNRRR